MTVFSVKRERERENDVIYQTVDSFFCQYRERQRERRREEILNFWSTRSIGFKEINNLDFDHENHSLKPIKNPKMVFGDDNDKKEGTIYYCEVCKESIWGGSLYGCISCGYFLHHTCANLKLVINHHIHPSHPLNLKFAINNDFIIRCLVCYIIIKFNSFFYGCSICSAFACIHCSLALTCKEEASTKFYHKGHPQHALTLQLRPASFRCDACHTTDEDLFYQCYSCDFWIHKTCTSLAPTIDIPHHPKHPLVLVYSLPDNFYKYDFYCAFCEKHIARNCWLYHCGNCRYFAHIKCAVNAEQPSTPSNAPGTSRAKEVVNDVLHFPMSDPFMDPLKQLHSGKMVRDGNDIKEISHQSHNHPLILNVGNTNASCSDDPIEVCDGCARPISLPYYCCKDGCAFMLHKYCAELPLTLLKHPLHPEHSSLHLVNTCGYKDLYCCDGCFSYGNTFAYKCKSCKFHLDVNCVFLPKTINHEIHEHDLIQEYGPNQDDADALIQHLIRRSQHLDISRFLVPDACTMCDKRDGGIQYSCYQCKFTLHMKCAMRYPHSVAHRYCKGHKVLLTYPPVEDHPEDFYCDICEKEMHPEYPLYYCLEGKNSFHPGCLAKSDPFENVKKDGTITVPYHKHPLTFVRRKKTAEYVCFGCNRDINGWLILECQSGICPFRFCYECHKKEVE